MFTFFTSELALAYHLGFKKDVILLQQKGVPRQGFLKYLLCQKEEENLFTDKDDLLEKIEKKVGKRWCSNYSRNLVVTDLDLKSPQKIIKYSDHTGTFPENVWNIQIKNDRLDVAAERAICILDYIKVKDENGTTISIDDRSPLKWAGQFGYEKTILPKDHGKIDIFAVHLKEPGLFLHSSKDTPREPIISKNGTYLLHFKLFSHGFPLVEFSVKMDLQWEKTETQGWKNKSKACLIR